MRDLPIPDAVATLLASRRPANLKPVEQAKAFRTLMDGQGWTAKKLAAELAISEGQVSRTLSLLKLDPSVQGSVERGELAATTAQEIARLDDRRNQVRLAAAAVEQGLNREEVADQVRTAPKKKAKKRAPASRALKYDGYKIQVARQAGIDPAEAARALRKAADFLDREATGEFDAEAA